MRALYDVNALLAILDRNHDSHGKVAAWYAANAGQGWVSCPLTQNGCLRILSQPRYRNQVSLNEAFQLLTAATLTQAHQFIMDDVSLLDSALVDPSRLSGHRQITDVYLLALAVAHDARLVTLDRRIPLAAVRAATEHNLVII